MYIINTCISVFIAPSNPQNVQAKVISSTKVELTWKKPSYEGSGQGIVGYDIYYNTSLDGTRNKVTIQSPDDFSNVVTGLSPATIYKFDIAARTDAGSGPLSFPQFATTWEGGKSTVLYQNKAPIFIFKKFINNSRGKYKRNECLINVCKSDKDLS